MIYNTIILSFVVQNFQSPHFLIKTQRYKYLKSLHFSLNLFIFSKMRLTQSFTPFLNSFISPHLISLYKRFFEKKFWANFKPHFTYKSGTITTNIIKSIFYKIYVQLLGHFSLNHKVISLKNLTIPSLHYLHIHTLIPFSFQIRTYDSLVFFILLLITSFYTPNQLTFKLFYSYIWRPQNFAMYDFMNRFYFRLKNH